MELSEFWVLVIAVGVCVAGVIVYVMFMIFLPEWVGITGKTALKNQKAAQGEDDSEPDLLDKMHK